MLHLFYVGDGDKKPVGLFAILFIYLFSKKLIIHNDLLLALQLHLSHLVEYYHALCSAYVLQCKVWLESKFLLGISLSQNINAASKRCPCIQSILGAAGSSFQLKGGGSSSICRKYNATGSWCLRTGMLEYISPAAQINDESHETECVCVRLGICMVVLVGLQ